MFLVHGQWHLKPQANEMVILGVGVGGEGQGVACVVLPVVVRMLVCSRSDQVVWKWLGST